MTHEDLGMSLKAASEFLKALIKDEHNKSNCSEEVEALLRMGVEQIKDGRSHDAILSFEEAEKLDPKNISPRLHLLKLYKFLGLNQMALVVGGGALTLAVESKPRGQIFNFLGEICTDDFQSRKYLSDLTQALYWYDRAVDADSQHVLPLWNRAKAYVLYQKYVEDTESKKVAAQRAKSSVESVLRMGNDAKGNSIENWPKLVDDAEKGNWWPDEAWWTERYKEMKNIAERNEFLEGQLRSLEGEEKKSMLGISIGQNRILRKALITVSIILMLLGLPALPSIVGGTETSFPGPDVRVELDLEDLEKAVEDDWEYLASVVDDRAHLASVEDDWEVLA